MLVSDFSYELPAELIAQQPAAERDQSRLLWLSRRSGRFEDRGFKQFPELLDARDLLVFNNTRVFPARLFARRGGQKARRLSARNPASQQFLKGQVEVLLTRELSREANEWQCLVHPGRKIGVGERLFFGEREELEATVVGRGEFGERRLRFEPTAEIFALLEQLGHVPLPPYISRPDRTEDRERYQTVYAQESGSVAAPTAGLHFTSGVLASIRERGIETAEITLHIGLGTFQPIRVPEVETHKLQQEAYHISSEAAAKINRALTGGRRIVAVGTTTVRALEHAASVSEAVRAGPGAADLFIYPGFQFRIVGALLTNFHLPRSTLLMLACAFGGTSRVLAAYRHAVEERYRFYSYGDCMFIE